MAVARKYYKPEDHAEHVMDYFRAAQREYRRRNREKWTKYNRDFYARNRQVMRDYAKAWKAEWKKKPENHGKDAKRTREVRAAMRAEALKAYGGQCKCCGEATVEFLALDHVNNDGNVMRKIHGNNSCGFYRWIKKNGYPDSLQILCHNCNMAKSTHGLCPHQKGGVT